MAASLLFLVLLLPFAGAVGLPFLGERRTAHAGWLALPIPAVVVGLLLLLAPHSAGTGPAAFAEASLPWVPSMGLEFHLWLPGFSFFFALLIAGVGLLVVVYAIGYMAGDPNQHRFFGYLMMFMGSMLGMSLAGDLLLLFVFWELTSIASFLLIGYFHDREASRFGAQAAFLITVVGGLAMLIGILMLGISMGDLNSARSLGLRQSDLLRFSSLYEHAGELAGFLATHAPGRFGVIMVLLLLGAFTKSAQAPFHIWLPGAMEAPTPVSTYLHSATMVKAGLFLAARLVPIFGAEPGWFLLVGYVGLFTFVMGAILAYFADDIKAVLAYTTISQLGLILAVYGHATFLGVNLDVYHIINHAAYKATLFMVAGILTHALHTRSLRKMRGLWRSMPITCVIACVAAYSLAGLPGPTSGFVSKELFLDALIRLWREPGGFGAIEGLLAVGMAAVGASFIVATALRLTLGVFFSRGLPHEEDETSGEHRHAPRDPGFLMWGPPAVLAALTIVLGINGHAVEHLMASRFLEFGTVHRAIDPAAHVFSYWHGWQPALFVSLFAVAAGATLFLFHRRLSNVFSTTVVEAAQSPWAERAAFLARLRPSVLYRRGVTNLAANAGRFNRTYLRGDLSLYLCISLLVLAIVSLLSIAQAPGLVVSVLRDLILLPTRTFESLAGLASMALFLGMLGCVFALTRVKVRFAMVIFTSVSGYLTCLFYVLYRAPDLALTQLLVETVSITLFLITFRLLPTFQEEDAVWSPRVRTLHKAVAVGVGIVAFLVVWIGIEYPVAGSISNFYLLNTVAGPGGTNAVNTIIVDFRGYDTLGEIAVLTLALIGTAVLLSRNVARPAPLIPDAPEAPSPPPS